MVTSPLWKQPFSPPQELSSALFISVPAACTTVLRRAGQPIPVCFPLACCDPIPAPDPHPFSPPRTGSTPSLTPQTCSPPRVRISLSDRPPEARKINTKHRDLLPSSGASCAAFHMPQADLRTDLRKHCNLRTMPQRKGRRSRAALFHQPPGRREVVILLLV